MHSGFLSDSIVLAATTPGESTPTPEEMSLLFYVVASGVRFAQARGAIAKPVLAYRGCIAIGPMIVDEPFVIGEAVDEAALGMEKADAAIVWLTPGAVAAYDDSLQHRPTSDIFPYDVRLRDGRRLQTLVANPLLLGEPIEPVVLNMLESFTDPQRVGSQPPVEVVVKQQNTKAFLAAAAEQILRVAPPAWAMEGS